MQVKMEVQGLDQLRQTSKAFSGKLDRQLKPAVRDTALEVRERAKNKAKTFSIGGFYPAAIRHLIKGDGLSAEVYSVAKSSRSIEEGRRAGEVVPFGLLLRWVRRRGLARSVSVITRRVVRTRSSATDRAEAQMVRDIQAGIRAHGTKPLPHMLPAAQESKSGWQRRVRKATETALRTVKGV